MKYDKLVRDRIPDIIRERGSVAVTHVASEEEYWVKLTQKLEEEVREYLKEPKSEELTDILEVVYALAEMGGLSRERLEQLRAEKATERGAFRQRIILEETE